MKKCLCLLLIFILTITGCQQAAVNPNALETTTIVENISNPSPSYTDYSETMYTYKGQGVLSLSATETVEIDLSINSQPIGSYTLSSDPLSIEIGDFTMNGNNIISYTYDASYAGEITLNHNAPMISDVYTGTEFTADELNQLDDYINYEIAEGFPGAVLLIMHNGEIVKNTAYGNALVYDGLDTLDTPQPMTTDTLFDLASVTKVYATTLAIMKLEDEGLLSTSDFVYEYLDEFDTEETSSITIEHLLTHTSGLNASHRFYDPDNKHGEEFYSLDRATTVSLIPSLPLKYDTGTDSAYSDLGFIALGAVVEEITGMSLDVYVEDNIYKELGLSSTLYTPLDKGFVPEDIAATERVGNTRDDKYEWPDVRDYTLQGEVHDELAYYAMNGISGNAGLFSNAYELAIMSQMLLNDGIYGEQKFFEKDTVEKFTTQSTLNERYCLGFDNSENNKNYRRYSIFASAEAFGKTGWTGTNVLIDPEHHLVVVLLTNKRHTPFEKGSFLGSDYQTGQYAPVITQIYEMLLDTTSYDYAYDNLTPDESHTLTDVSLGIDRLDEFDILFKDKNVGLITNHSGKNSSGISSIDILYNSTNLVSLFSPEHGIEGLHEAGERFGSTVDLSTDLPVYSLYGDTKKPTKEMLQNLDLLTFDIQDVGARFYTYIYTMLYAMEACAENDVTFAVFDRPNPLGGTGIEGNLVEDDFTSFVGLYPLPIRHGLTMGELALYINNTYDIGCDLRVIPMENWHRDLYFDDTSLEFIAPSPNMKTTSTTLVYPGSCFVEGTNISEGRGTEYPFELIGAPFINPYTLADELNSYNLEGVTFIPTSFMPDSSKYKDELCYGVRIRVDDKAVFKSVDMGISLIYALNHLYNDDFETVELLNVLAGMDLIQILESMEEEDSDENEEGLTREDLLLLFETPSEFVDGIEAYYLY